MTAYLLYDCVIVTCKLRFLGDNSSHHHNINIKVNHNSLFLTVMYAGDSCWYIYEFLANKLNTSLLEFQFLADFN